MNYLINIESVKFGNFFYYVARYCEIKIILEKIASVGPINLIDSLLSAIKMFANGFRLQSEKSRFSIDDFKIIRLPAIAKIKKFFSTAVLASLEENFNIFYSVNKKIKKIIFGRFKFLLPYDFVLICVSRYAPENVPFELGRLSGSVSVLHNLLLCVIFMFLSMQVLQL